MKYLLHWQEYESDRERYRAFASALEARNWLDGEHERLIRIGKEWVVGGELYVIANNGVLRLLDTFSGEAASDGYSIGWKSEYQQQRVAREAEGRRLAEEQRKERGEGPLSPFRGIKFLDETDGYLQWWRQLLMAETSGFGGALGAAQAKKEEWPDVIGDTDEHAK